VADPTERLTKLIALLLESSRAMTFEEIADELVDQYTGTESARRAQFERDKAVLRAEGIPFEMTVVVGGDKAGATAYRIERTAYELPPLALELDEKRALQLALATVHIDPGAATGALWKLGTDDEGGAAPVSATLPDVPQLPSLFDAEARRALVSFRYHGKARTVEPWALLFRNGFWYLVGRDRGAGEQRVFRADRIEGAVSVGEPGAFTPPEDFDARAAVSTDAKSLGGGEPMEALVLVDGSRAAKVRREVGEDAVAESRADGSVIVRVPCTNMPAFRSWVLGLLEHAEVVSPPSVRDDVVAWLKAMA
jgi:proteasome accessory factor B